MIKAVIFDLDGTILDNDEAYNYAFTGEKEQYKVCTAPLIRFVAPEDLVYYRNQ